MSSRQHRPAGVARTIRHDGGAIYAVDHPGEGPPLVAMHGFPDDARIYDRLVPHLAPRRVVTFDWFGYGRSGRRDGTRFQPGDRQRELRAVLDSLNLADVVLVAHDAAGPEAVDFALAMPERVRRLVLLNTYYGRTEALHLPDLIGLLADPELAHLADALLDDELQRLWLLQFTARRFGGNPDEPGDVGTVAVLPQFFGGPDHPDALAEIRAWTADLRRALDAQDEQVASGRLAALAVPVTMAFGAADPYLGPALARELAGLFPRADLSLLDGASHWPMWDQPAAVADLILARPAG